MFKAAPPAPGRMEQAFHIVPHAAPHIQFHGPARRVPVPFLRRRQHQLRGTEIRRPAPQPGLQQQAVLAGGAHAQQAPLFLVQLGQQLFQLAQTARQGQGCGPGGIARGLLQHQLLPGLLHQAEDVFPLLLMPAPGQGIRQGPGRDAAGGAVVPGLLLRLSVRRRVVEHVPAAQAQVFQQGLPVQPVIQGQGTAQGRGQHRPVPPVRQGLFQLAGLRPAQGLFLRAAAHGQKAHRGPFAQVQQQPGGQGLPCRGIAAFRRHVRPVRRRPALGGKAVLLAFRRAPERHPAAQGLLGRGLPAHQQPELATAETADRGQDAVPGQIFAQAHDRGRRGPSGGQAAAGKEEEGFLAGGAQAKLALAAAARLGTGLAARGQIDVESQQAGGRFLHFFQPAADDARCELLAETEKKMGVHNYAGVSFPARRPGQENRKTGRSPFLCERVKGCRAPAAQVRGAC